MQPGYRILDHPADIGIESWGSTFSEALSMAVSGLVSLIVDPSSVEPTEQRFISVSAEDIESLVVKTLSEVLFLFDGAHFVPKTLEVFSESPNGLQGSLSGEPLQGDKHHMRIDVKAVTYHQLSVNRRPASVTINVYLDI
ncbi:MAG TPA: archease [Bacteroidota bacterium]|nr:archease [Bacteroidota bacterium]